jgi:1-acyl-sn-glycerol-3-phosphate acyltransferase
VNSGDVFVSWLPLYHDMGLIGAWFGSLYFGMLLVLMPPLAFLARPGRWLAAITRHRGTVSAAPNFAYDLCARKIGAAELPGLDLASWRLAMNGAEPVSAKTLAVFATRFVPCGLKRETLFPVYGLAECSVGLTFPPLGREPLIDAVQRETFTARRYAAPSAGEDDPLLVPSCGRVLPEHEIRVVDDAGQELPDRYIGHLQFRGPSATTGYYRNPDATRSLFRDGWLDSGDYAYSAAGEIYLTGRVKDLIIRGGRNIYPYELEQAVGGIPGVRKGCVAAFASTDPINATERLVVVAEIRDDEASQGEALRQRINEVAIDTIGVPVDEIVLAPPNTILKTSSGKIRRAASRDAYEQGKINTRAAPVWRQHLRLGAALLRSRLAQAWRRAMRALFASWCWLALALTALPAALPVGLLQDPARGRRLMHGAARLFMRLIGMPVHVTGGDKLSAATHLLLVNHGSYLDALALYAALPPSPGYAFVAKQELGGQAAMHAVLSGVGTLFIERFSALKGSEDVEAMVAALSAGTRLIVFPEGTFTREAGLKTFRMGAFLAAARAGVPVLVAGLRGGRVALRDGQWMPRRTRLELEIGPSLAARGNDWSAAIRLRDEARQEMLKLCGEHDLMR